MVNPKLKDKLNDQLCQAVLALKNMDECYQFFEDICTISELKSMSQRLEVARMLKAGAEKTGLKKALVTGGVAASALLRQLLEERRLKTRGCPEIVFGKPEMSGDNAVGVALIGAKRFINS